jgi:hypothetical protein
MFGDKSAERSIQVALICGPSLAVIADSNPDGRVDICLFCMFYDDRYMFLLRHDHTSRGVIPSVVCLSDGGNSQTLSCHEKKSAEE